MRTVSAVILFSVVCCLSASAYTVNQSTKTATSDGSVADTQAAINASADGWTVLIPAGTFTWASGVTISGKGIHLRGAGSGRVIGRSLSSVSVGTGTKTFTTQSGLSINPGDTLRIVHTPNNADFMLGTVTSYSGTTLTMNITSSGGSGTWAFWVVQTIPSTIISGSIASMLTLKEATARSVELSGIKFVTTYSTVSAIYVNDNGTAKPVLIHDCWFSVNSSGRMFSWTSNRGIMWNCSFDNGFVASGFTGTDNDAKAIGFGNTATDSSWTTRSTMGTNDTTGLNNVYVEDCDFHGMYLACYDADDNSRVVIRHCLFNNSGGGTHGQDSSQDGVRHLEIYNCEFVFTDATDTETFNVNSFYFGRGGTGVICDNIIPNVTSQEWGDKPEIRLTVLNLHKPTGGFYSCWGAGIPGIQYPAPRQVGMGHVTGGGSSGSGGYQGDSEPLYIWGNTGGGNYGSPSIQDPQEGCSNPDNSSDYIVIGRDVILGPKPGYAKYTYPHPLRGAAVTTTPAAPPTAPRSLQVAP